MVNSTFGHETTGWKPGFHTTVRRAQSPISLLIGWNICLIPNLSTWLHGLILSQPVYNNNTAWSDCKIVSWIIFNFLQYSYIWLLMVIVLIYNDIMKKFYSGTTLEMFENREIWAVYLLNSSVVNFFKLWKRRDQVFCLIISNAIPYSYRGWICLYFFHFIIRVSQTIYSYLLYSYLTLLTFLWFWLQLVNLLIKSTYIDFI